MPVKITKRSKLKAEGTAHVFPGEIQAVVEDPGGDQGPGAPPKADKMMPDYRTPMTDFLNRSGVWLERAMSSNVLLTRHRRPYAVIVSWGRFKAMKEKIQKLENAGKG